MSLNKDIIDEENFEEETINDLSIGELDTDVIIDDEDEIKEISIEGEQTKGLNDLHKDIQDTLGFSIIPKIKIKKNKTKDFDSLQKHVKKSITDIKKTKKDININKNNPEKHFYTLDAKDIKNIESQVDNGPYVDIFKSKLPFNDYLLVILKKAYNSIKFFVLNNKKKFSYLSFLIIIGLVYFYTIFYNLKTGYETLADLQKSENISHIGEIIDDSRINFTISSLLFKPINGLNYIVGNNTISKADTMINSGLELTKAIDKLLIIYDSVNLNIKNKGLNNIYFSQLLFNSKEIIFESNSHLINSLNGFNKIDDLGNPVLNNQLNILKEKLGQLIGYGNFAINNFDSILEILGHSSKKKYIIAFQNSDEIRPTGGFMGSLGELDIFRGKIEEFHKRDIYSYEWDIKPYREIAPEGINRITDSFGLRDSNYFVEFSKSSEKIKFFLEKANIEIDGVIYINLNILKDFLVLTDGFYFSKIDKTIDKNNYKYVLSALVEAKIYKEGTLGTPKSILFEFIDEYKEKLISESKYEDYLNILKKYIENRNIVFNTFDSDTNNLLDKFHLSGNIDFNSNLDFNYPVFTSLSGNKSDRYMQRSYFKIVNQNEDCSIDTKIEIKLKHDFDSNDEINIKRLFYEHGIVDLDNYTDLFNIQGLGDNYQYVRLLLPKNAIIRNKPSYFTERTYDKFKIVSFYMNTKRLETSSVYLNYKLANLDCKKYDYKFYNQSGIDSFDFSFNLGDININKNGLESDFEYK